MEATRARTPRADVGAVETTTRDDASDDIATDEQRRPLHYWIRARGETDRSTAERTARGGDGRRSRSVDGRGYVRERDASVGDLPEGRARCRLRARRRDDRGNSIVDCDACHLSFVPARQSGRRVLFGSAKRHSTAATISSRVTRAEATKERVSTVHTPRGRSPEQPLEHRGYPAAARVLRALLQRREHLR